jgi:microcystin-dependent protein
MKKKLQSLEERVSQTQMEDINQMFNDAAESCELSKQDALWSVMLSQSVYAIGELGASDAKQTMQGMLDLAFEIAVEETDNSRN